MRGGPITLMDTQFIPILLFLMLVKKNYLICYKLFQEHVEGYLELSAKTKKYFATAVSMWDADFYIKVDDDVHVNIGEQSSPSISFIALHSKLFHLMCMYD